MEGTDTLRTRGLSGQEGADTLRWIAPSEEGHHALRALVIDAAGNPWSDTLGVDVYLDKPVADAGRDTVASYWTPYALHGRASDGYGRIVRWERDIGGTRVFPDQSGENVQANEEYRP